MIHGSFDDQSQIGHSKFWHVQALSDLWSGTAQPLPVIRFQSAAVEKKRNKQSLTNLGIDLETYSMVKVNVRGEPRCAIHSALCTMHFALLNCASRWRISNEQRGSRDTYSHIRHPDLDHKRESQVCIAYGKTGLKHLKTFE